MPSAQVEIIRMYGGSPSIPPQPEVGVEPVTSSSAVIGSGDGPAGSIDVPIPRIGESRSVVQAFALRVLAVASPLTTISNVRFYVDQHGKNDLGGEWDGIRVLTPDGTVNPSLLDAFDDVSGVGQGLAADYREGTRVLGPTGYIGGPIESVYGITDLADTLDDANLSRGQLDLTGLGRLDGTPASFGNSVNDVSRMFLMQAAFGYQAAPGSKPGLQVIVSYDEDE